MHSNFKTFAGALTVAGVLGLIPAVAAVPASAAAATMGTVHVWLAPGSGAVSKILLTGRTRLGHGGGS